MQLYRFSPIKNADQLMEAITYTHTACHQLSKNVLGEYLHATGNIGIFCHYEEEYTRLLSLRDELTEHSDDPHRKYCKLLKPITIAQDADIPGASYTHLYIRRPDPYRAHVGDVDFYVEHDAYDELKQKLNEERIFGARLFPRSDLDMIELYHPDIDALAYVNPSTISEKAEIKLS